MSKKNQEKHPNDLNRQLSYLRHNLRQVKSSENLITKKNRDIKKNVNFMPDKKIVSTAEKVAKILKKGDVSSMRYKNTRYVPSPIFNPELRNEQGVREKRFINASQYRKFVFDYEGTIDKQQKQKKRMKRSGSEKNMFLESEKLGYGQQKISTKKLNNNRTASTIQFG